MRHTQRMANFLQFFADDLSLPCGIALNEYTCSATLIYYAFPLCLTRCKYNLNIFFWFIQKVNIVSFYGEPYFICENIL